MANKINFITGETYTLSELFSGDRKILIPDLQRDYCWADPAHTDAKIELVSNFTQNLVKQYESDDSEQLSLGLIYGYEEPVDHIQLCDGQQRITTLFLLVGMLNRYSKNDRLKKYLISDFEYNHDDKEPYLQYSIRESSLYFLSDLVCRFFINRELPNVKSIATKDNFWYFTEYNQDPSIQSIIRALLIFEEALQNKDEVWLSRFGDFLVNRLTFMYYDMLSRINGEETFVVINTTGEPLSATQNLKPLVLNAEINKNNINESFAQWEEIETWFWNNRIVANGNDTADAGFEEFFRWVTIIECAKSKDADKIKQIINKGSYLFPIEEIPFTLIYGYWKSVQFIFENSSYFPKDYISPKTVLSQIDCFRLLPVILYCQKWISLIGDDLSIRRVFEFFNNLSRYQSINLDNNSVYNAIDAINMMPNNDLLSLIDCQSVSKHIRTEEELTKLNILKDTSRRLEIEQQFWYTQDYKGCNCHEIWKGELQTLIEWSTDSGSFDLPTFIKYRDLVDRIFSGNSTEVDLTRRALLTVGLDRYPRIFNGYTNWSFGYEFSDWSALIKDNKPKFKQFFDTLLACGNINEQQEGMISLFSDKSNWWYIFIENENYLSYCGEKKVQLVGGDIIRLLTKAKASANHKYLYGWQEVDDKNDWTHWTAYGSDRIYTNHQEYNVAIDLCVDSNNITQERFFLKLFNREGDTKKHFDLQTIIDQFHLKIDKDGRAKSDSISSVACYDLCEKLRSTIR